MPHDEEEATYCPQFTFRELTEVRKGLIERKARVERSIANPRHDITAGDMQVLIGDLAVINRAMEACREVDSLYRQIYLRNAAERRDAEDADRKRKFRD